MTKKTRIGHEPRCIDSPEKMTSWLKEALEGAIKSPGLTAERRKQFGYKNLPTVTLTHSEKKNLQDIEAHLDGHMTWIARDLQKLPEPDRASARQSLTAIMCYCFQIGQQTQYGPALVRSAREAAVAQTTAAAVKRSELASTDIVKEHVARYEKSQKKAVGPGTLAARLLNSINADLEAQGKSKKGKEAVRKTIERMMRNRTNER